MLVCSVSLKRRDAVVAANLIETATALDAPGLVTLFGTLVDSPGDAQDILDAFVGQRVKETATATDSVSVAMVYKIAVLEDTTAVAAVTQDATGVAVLVPRSGMVGTVYVNSDGTARQANANGIMINL